MGVHDRPEYASFGGQLIGGLRIRVPKPARRTASKPAPAEETGI
jgi:hypothetical protein